MCQCLYSRKSINLQTNSRKTNNTAAIDILLKFILVFYLFPIRVPSLRRQFLCVRRLINAERSLDQIRVARRACMVHMNGPRDFRFYAPFSNISPQKTFRVNHNTISDGNNCGKRICWFSGTCKETAFVCLINSNCWKICNYILWVLQRANNGIFAN